MARKPKGTKPENFPLEAETGTFTLRAMKLGREQVILQYVARAEQALTYKKIPTSMRAEVESCLANIKMTIAAIVSEDREVAEGDVNYRLKKPANIECTAN